MITDMETWRADESESIYRLLVYRRMFTPYEQQHAFSDESHYEDSHYQFGMIRDSIDLGGGNWMIGFEEIIEGEFSGVITYYNLSEIRLSKFEIDQKMLDEEDEEWDGTLSF